MANVRADRVLSVRMSTEDLDEIKRRAAEAGMSQAEFVVLKCLDREADSPVAALALRVSELEAKVAKLERRRSR